MTMRAIAQIGAPVLRDQSRPLSAEELADPETQHLIDDMIETMRDADGAGIAANQVGVAVRICVIEVNHNERYPYKPPLPLTILVNPELTVLDNETWLNNEGCLSVSLRGDLRRFMSVGISALDRDGNPFSQVYRGLSAGTVPHELDHLDGKLIVDRVYDNTTLTTWQNFAEHRLTEYLERIRPVVDRTEP